MSDQRASKELFSCKSNDRLYDCWGEVDDCSDATEADGKRLIVYSYSGSAVPQFARRVDDFNRDFSPVVLNDPQRQLCVFYQVSTLGALVEAQAKHIERLQAQLPSDVKPSYVRAREG